jgi:putative transposase
VDTLGLILTAVVHPADLQDRDGAVLVLDRHTRRLFPFLETIFADAAYAGGKLRRAMAGTPWKIEVVKRSDTAKGFQVIPRRWVVERTIAWINRCRRLAKDYENLNRSALGFIRLASIRLMLRRLTRYCPIS